MTMNEFSIRKAVAKDIPFLVETIVEAEKSGTDRLSYSTIFGLSEEEVKDYLTEMLNEEIDGCELSISSFLVSVKNGKIAAALSAWVEGLYGVPSAVLKGNLLNYFLPRKCLEQAASVNSIIREIHVEYSQNTIQIGAGFVAKEFRGNKLLGVLNDEIIERLAAENPGVSEVYAQIFSCNVPSIKTYEKAGFELVMIKKATNIAILKYLPSDTKIVMNKKINKKRTA